MKPKNRWLLVLLTGLLGGTSLGPGARLQAAPSSQGAAETAKVSINRADAGELERLRGIGPMLAQRIIQYRETKGPFKNLEDLVQVPGIGQSKFEKLKAQLTL